MQTVDSSALCRQQIARFWNRDTFDTGLLLLQEAESQFPVFHFLSATDVWQMPDTEIQEICSIKQICCMYKAGVVNAITPRQLKTSAHVHRATFHDSGLNEHHLHTDLVSYWLYFGSNRTNQHVNILQH